MTLSVLPVSALPYRPLVVGRLQDFLDGQAGLGTGPDPPPRTIEEGCLKRAWQRLKTRVHRLTEILGQLLPASIDNASQLWRQLRQHLGCLSSILSQLAQIGKSSLLGDYRCLQLPSSEALPL